MLVISVLSLVVFGLWLNGRYWRSQWTLEPTLHTDYPATGGDGRTLTILWTGAFNDAMEHFEGLIEIYQQIGDVCVVRYAGKRFSARMAMLVAYRYVLRTRHKYDTIVLSGASLGGEEALLFEAHMNSRPDHGLNLKVIGCDVPLGGHHLPQPAWLLRLVKYIHIGPLFNLLSSFVTHLIFKKLSVRETRGVDHNNWGRHMAAMWGCKLSVIAEQIAAIVELRPFAPTGNPSAYIRCNKDDVITGDAAAAAWCELRGMSLDDVIHVEGGHVQFVEMRAPWRSAHKRALRQLGFTVT